MKHSPCSLFAAVLLGHAGAALGCGVSPLPYYVVDTEWPTGDAVPRNAPLVVELAAQVDGPTNAVLNPKLVLTLRGEAVEIPTRALGAAPRLVWIPNAALAPDATYQAHFNSGYEREPDTMWEFTTGDAVAEPLSLQGKLVVTLESGTDPIVECGLCGTNCVEKGQRLVTKARVKLPVVQDGVGARSGELWLTDDTPRDLSLPEKADVASAPEVHLVSLASYVSFDDAGLATRDVLVTLPEEADPYVPCFALRVTDDRGDSAVAESLCLNRQFSSRSTESDGLDRDPGDGEQASTRSGCSFAPASSQNARGSSVLALACAMAALRRRFASRFSRAGSCR